MPIVTSSASTFNVAVAASVTTIGLIRLQKTALRIVQTIRILPLDHPAQQIGAQVMISWNDLILLDLNYRKECSQVVIDVALRTMMAVTLLGMTVMLGFLSLRSWIGHPQDWALSCATTTRSKLYFNPLTL